MTEGTDLQREVTDRDCRAETTILCQINTAIPLVARKQQASWSLQISHEGTRSSACSSKYLCLGGSRSLLGEKMEILFCFSSHLHSISKALNATKPGNYLPFLALRFWQGLSGYESQNIEIIEMKLFSKTENHSFTTLLQLSFLPPKNPTTLLWSIQITEQYGIF